MSLGQEQLGSQAGCLTAISDERTEVGEVQKLVWSCAASLAEPEGKKAREDLENKILADAHCSLGSPLN